LRHAAGKLVRVGIGEAHEPDQTQGVFDASAMGTQQPARFQSERNVAPHRPPWIKRRVLKNDDARRIGCFDLCALCEQ
jgi:hypothetical protein